MTTKKEEMSLIGDAIRYAARHLGTSNAGTEMGALEVLAFKTFDGLQEVAGSINKFGEVIQEGVDAIDHVAGAIDRLADAVAGKPTESGE